MSQLVVLHIDADPKFREEFRRLLAAAKMTVVSCQDSQEPLGLEPSRDFGALVVDETGFDFAAADEKQNDTVPRIVLSNDPKKANFPADDLISKKDQDWFAQVVDDLRRFQKEPISPMIRRSQRAFERDLDGLLKTHYRQWVAYHGEERIGFARSETALYERCRRQGFKADEFLVFSVQPLLADDAVTFSPKV